MMFLGIGAPWPHRCSENMQQVYRATTILKCDLNKVAFNLFRTLLVKYIRFTSYNAVLQKFKKTKKFDLLYGQD